MNEQVEQQENNNQAIDSEITTNATTKDKLLKLKEEAKLLRQKLAEERKLEKQKAKEQREQKKLQLNNLDNLAKQILKIVYEYNKLNNKNKMEYKLEQRIKEFLEW